MESSSSSGTDTTNPNYANSLKIQILAYDSYQTKPSVLDKNYSTIGLPHNEEIVASDRPFAQVPIIRIFGKLQTGHTVLANVHNCFPYIFIEYDGDIDKNRDVTLQNLRQFKLEIEKLLYLSFKKTKLKKTNTDGENENDDDVVPDVFNDYSKDDNDPSNYENKYISSLQLVKSIPFYGYHIGYSSFVKISLLNPRYISRLSAMLLLSKVNGKVFQPYEAHIPFLLQFLADFNLYGCDWMYLAKFLWRSPIISTSLLGEFTEEEFEYQEKEVEMFNEMKINQQLKDFLSENIIQFKENSMLGEQKGGLNVTLQDQFPRTSSSLLELDCIPQWILNISTLQTRDLHHDFIEISNLTSLNSSQKFLTSTEDILKDVLHQRIIRNLDYTDFFKKLSLMNENDVRNYSGQTDWIEQEHLNELLEHCIELSKGEYRKQKSPDFATFVKNSSPFQFIQTPKESIFSGMFKNIQWHKLLLAEKMESNMDNKFSFSTISSSSPVDMRVLPSSMFEVNDDVLPDSDIEPENADDDMMEDSELDRLEEDLFAIAKPPHILNKTVSFTTDLSSTPPPENDKFIFTQVSKRRSAAPLVSHLSPVSHIKKMRSTGSSSFEFRGTNGLPLMNEDFYNSFEDNGLLKHEYADPFYSKLTDVPSLPFIFAGRKFVLHSANYPALEKVSVNGDSPSADFVGRKRQICSKERMFEFRSPMPSFAEVSSWLSERLSVSKSQLLKSQIVQSTPKLKYGFKFPSVHKNYKRKKSKLNKLITLAVEIHVNNRIGMKPDPKEDEILAIFWSFDKENYPFDLSIAETGVLILADTEDADNLSRYLNTTETPVAIFDNEISMIRELISVVKLIDPDLLAGFEIHGKSWGYIIERFRTFYDIDLCSKLSRVIYKGNDKFGDRWGYTHASAIKITGRHMINLWRILRNDLNLLRYSIENVSFHLLHRRIPHYSENQLTEWFKSGKPSDISAVLNYYISRTKLDLEIIEKQEVIGKTTEQAKLIGVDFYSIFYRGSQFKVESFLVRLTKSENFMLISPSKQQVFKADALQCIPLVMEPTSAFYKSPLVVLDFQSLYPSIVIAYNYCYSTLLGRLRGYNARYPQTIGVTKNKLPAGLLDLLKDHITISPNGLMFVKPEVRKSLLAKMLTDILETRFLVKKSMADIKDDYELTKLYNSRQLALKLLANVTYGYTSATFSGRMPCGDIADAIVSTGRETLNRSIKIIEDNERWGAKVVYGDTDSLFLYFPGKSREEAFKFGKEAAQYITSINPKPMALKFEKVYHPCVLISKKRYVGYSFAHEDQKVLTFDAKGIETVRRDGIPAQQKMVEKSLRILFETLDLSQVKDYVQEQFSKIMSNKISIQDFCFAKEVRMGTYKDERYAPAGAHVTKKLMEADKRAEPQYKERVPYVVLQSHKGDRLRDRCVTPQFFLDNEVEQGLRLDSEYYITKVLIPPLERIFNLMGVDIKEWYRDMPRKLMYRLNYEDRNLIKRRKLDNLNLFLQFSNCICCSGRTKSHKKLCSNCMRDELSTIVKLTYRVSMAERDFNKLMRICRICSTSGYGQKSLISNSVSTAENCNSDDCPIFYSRLKAQRKLDNVSVRESAAIEELNLW